jgi:hypothetical protein
MDDQREGVRGGTVSIWMSPQKRAWSAFFKCMSVRHPEKLMAARHKLLNDGHKHRFNHRPDESGHDCIAIGSAGLADTG